MCTELALQQSSACEQCMRPKCDPQQGSRWAGKRAIALCPYRHGGSHVYSLCEHTASETHKPTTSACCITSVLHPCAAALRFFTCTPVAQNARVGTAPCLQLEPLTLCNMVSNIKLIIHKLSDITYIHSCEHTVDHCSCCRCHTFPTPAEL
jgi:hypothetical protein